MMSLQSIVCSCVLFISFSILDVASLKCPWVIKKADWTSRLITYPFFPMKNVSQVVIFHSPINGSCETVDNCSEVVRNMLILDMETYNNIDTRYNYFLGSDKKIYEGTGWWTHLYKENRYKIHKLKICFVGLTLEGPSSRPNVKMIEHLFQFLKCNEYRLTPNYKILVGVKDEFDAIKSVIKDEHKDILARVKLTKLDQAVPYDPPEEKYRQRWYEIIGYCLWPGNGLAGDNLHRVAN